MKKAILLGTSHPIQRGELKKDSFYSYIEELCKTNDIKAIAEEMDNECTSIAAEISAKLNITYKIIEPTPEEREELGIEDVTEIGLPFKFKYKVENHSDELSTANLPTKAYDAYNEKIQNIYRQRESEWLKRILKLNTWPVLIICGANHCQPFFELLSNEDIDTVKESSQWAICQNIQSDLGI